MRAHAHHWQEEPHPRQTINFEEPDKLSTRQVNQTKAPTLQCQGVPHNTTKTTLYAHNKHHIAQLDMDAAKVPLQKASNATTNTNP